MGRAGSGGHSEPFWKGEESASWGRGYGFLTLFGMTESGPTQWLCKGSDEWASVSTEATKAGWAVIAVKEKVV